MKDNNQIIKALEVCKCECHDKRKRFMFCLVCNCPGVDKPSVKRSVRKSSDKVGVTDGKLNPNTIIEKKKDIVKNLMDDFRMFAKVIREDVEFTLPEEELILKDLDELIALVQSTERTQTLEEVEALEIMKDIPFSESTIKPDSYRKERDSRIEAMNALRSTLRSYLEAMKLSINGNVEDKSKEVRASNGNQLGESKENTE